MLNFDQAEYAHVPQRTREALRAYFTDFVPPGGFLRAVLSNDLMEAMGRADEENRTTLFSICSLLYNECPKWVETPWGHLQTYGDLELVGAWLALRHKTDHPDWLEGWRKRWCVPAPDPPTPGT
jgi:hypothetical protein